MEGIEDSQAEYPPPRRRAAILAVLTTNLVIVFAANSTLFVALPAMSRALDANSMQTQWIVAAYSLFLAAFILVGGQLARRFGSRATMAAGLVLFLIASPIAAFASGAVLTITARCVMGLGGALIMPGTLETVMVVFPPERRAAAIAVWTSFTGLAGGLGPIVSGVVVAKFWPGSVFLILIPLVLASLVAAFVLIPNPRRHGTGRLDWSGTALSLFAIGLLVFSLINAQTVGWLTQQTVVGIFASLALLIAFLFRESTANSPLLNLRLFSDRRFSTGFGIMLLIFIGYYGVLYVSLSWLQVALEYSPLESALAWLPYALVVMCFTPIQPRITRSIGARWTAAGATGLCGGGFGLFTIADPRSGYVAFGASVVLFSLGMALIVPLTTSFIMAASAAIPDGTGGAAMTNISRDLGNALGVAILGSLATTGYLSAVDPNDGDLPSGVGASTPIEALAQARAAMMGDSEDSTVRVIQDAYTSGLHLVAIVAAAVCFAASALIAILLRPNGIRNMGLGTDAPLTLGKFDPTHTGPPNEG
ncbi:MFS transporter [Rhodococcus fascians]|uniref:MFS transporter n=1 Tax=unclassified Rhodococcus (in: high G+C Gram-positive bacteria) TaxID=192944 RepID=UPI001595A08A|nr:MULTISPECIES: MFS transporter [unclassified Rhodococcus (in: high G+C Gram-positive bacteria)]MBY4383825.1 MFS transporter [Rhodococcus fascians]MBY4399036.1 MFS transporter [Rhodococcus fascians]MBY4408574.1 MFS transporter [Rhodococcus fascians]MBY4423613.1 MFS transporter [Rhodococcus fascians]MBY4462863.1 MFS transporter [Rhodococcus fascians]